MALAAEKRGVTLLVLVFASLQLSIAAVYKVGDSAGWTTVGHVDYKQWAATKHFQVGDIIFFQYNSQFHNVMQVTHAEYKACNSSAPIATHSTGNDSITITNRGHHFFFCGVPGHCQAGQKVDINVPRDSSASTAPTPSASLASSAPSAKVPAPSPSAAAPFYTSKSDFFFKLGFAMAAFLSTCFA